MLSTNPDYKYCMHLKLSNKLCSHPIIKSFHHLKKCLPSAEDDTSSFWSVWILSANMQVQAPFRIGHSLWSGLFPACHWLKENKQYTHETHFHQLQVSFVPVFTHYNLNWSVLPKHGAEMTCGAIGGTGASQCNPLLLPGNSISSSLFPGTILLLFCNRT